MQTTNRITVNLSEEIMLFTRRLRHAGALVSPNQTAFILKAFDFINVANKDDFYFALRAALIRRMEDYPAFDRVFEEFWGAWAKGNNSKPIERSNLDKPLPINESSKAGLNNLAAKMQSHSTAALYSAIELVRFKDFSKLTPDEESLIKKYIKANTWLLALQRTHRWRAGNGLRYDLRATLRHNLRFGAEILSWKRQRRKFRPRPLIVLADVSGSMKSYTRILLHYFYSFSNHPAQSVETFVFGTRLTRITKELSARPARQALSKVSRQIKDWEGGTRIGASIKTFNHDWARRVLRSNAVVLLISDGWDRGDPALLAKEIARLQRSCRRLIWLNPLLGSPDYQPLTRSIRTALQFVDDFLPIHNLASIEQLNQYLASLMNETKTSQTTKFSLAHARYPA